ncbi:Nif3-like dinuclear metal center hexameric protein [Microcoleus sp. FACHB-672]|uniref:Nif3-like dinuclear metal center hexameric protein n=1 Tax=Microcoleus sp. FACHB-672 TaxID=2692825 RepID=UPI00168718F0|nr:Nif3-like dinuclear metal center hexameric protein [Microcoleus sp. FACHB-672]MBD2041426.1 Nif3-like dinuclear metal center hexameric protein [Microcoleus sp. FACHB-672]
MIVLENIAQFLDSFFAVNRFEEKERGGIYHHSSKPIRRFGLALEPGMQLTKWVNEQQLDALFLHRPWKLEPGQLAPDIGIVAYHLAFDERLTLGFNPRLAEVFGMSELEVLGEKEGRPIGMIGNTPVENFSVFCEHLNEVFGGSEEIYAGTQSNLCRVAVVGAMTDALVREAALRGADLYITGQLRKPALSAVQEAGIAVVAVGHRRCEEWGLKALAGVLRERWFELEVILNPES